MRTLADFSPTSLLCLIRGVNLTSFLDSLHMVSYYLPILFMALNATDKDIIGGGWGGGGVNLSFMITTWYKNTHKSFNYGPISTKI